MVFRMRAVPIALSSIGFRSFIHHSHPWRYLFHRTNYPEPSDWGCLPLRDEFTIGFWLEDTDTMSSAWYHTEMTTVHIAFSKSRITKITKRVAVYCTEYVVLRRYAIMSWILMTLASTQVWTVVGGLHCGQGIGTCSGKTSAKRRESTL